MNENPATESFPESVVNDAPSDYGLRHLANRLQLLDLPDSKPDTHCRDERRSGRFEGKLRAQLNRARHWLATMESILHEIEQCKQRLLKRDPRDLDCEELLRSVRYSLDSSIPKFVAKMEKGVERLLERWRLGYDALIGVQYLSTELEIICTDAIKIAANQAQRLLEAAERVEVEAADADATPATVSENLIVHSKEEDTAQKTSSESDTKCYPTPRGTAWGNVTLTIYDEGTLNARAMHGLNIDYTAEEIGLVDGRTKKPDLQWELLLQMSKNGGVDCPVDPSQRDRYDKRIERLNSALQNFFGILDSKPITLELDPLKGDTGPIRNKCWEPVLGLHVGNSKSVARELGHM